MLKRRESGVKVLIVPLQLVEFGSVGSCHVRYIQMYLKLLSYEYGCQSCRYKTGVAGPCVIDTALKVST